MFLFWTVISFSDEKQKQKQQLNIKEHKTDQMLLDDR